jgi:hypothetical protein
MSGFLAHVMADNLVKRRPFLDTSPGSIAPIFPFQGKGFNKTWL